jgi:hypothetical protein
MDSHFVVVFDIGQKHPDWNVLVTPVLFMLVSLGFACWEFLTKRRFKYFMVAGVFAFIAFVVGYGYYKDSTYGLREAAASLREGQVSVVEGRVRDFVPMPFSGHPHEQFTVNGVHFSYSDYEIQPCFNTSSSHGGPIRSDIWVRLSYRGDCILRVEVWQSSN